MPSILPRLRSWFALAALGLTVGASFAACTPTTDLDEVDDESVEETESNLSTAARRERLTHVRDVARKRGLTNPVLVAGIANAETRLSHCWSELTWACKGPWSADCNGPVAAGASDGACWERQGGLGMFQFDAGDYDDTIAREGSRVLSVDGNIDAAIDFIVAMVRDTSLVGGVSTDAQAIAWMNGATVGSSRYDTWLRVVVTHYNGCRQGQCSIFWDRYDSYDTATREVLSEVGASFFTQDATKPVAPIEVDWGRETDGTYLLRAIAPTSVATIEYTLDGFSLAKGVKKDDPATTTIEKNYPAKADVTQQGVGRRLEVIGRDAAGATVARGVASVDVTTGAGVFIRQIDGDTFEIGLERAPSSVAAIEVKVDGKYVLVDEVSGAKRSTRKAVRYTFSQLGTRDFAVTTFGSDGAVRGTLNRSFALD
jgi:hypothetical protein